MVADLTLSTPLGQAKDPGSPPAPGVQAEPAAPLAAPKDVASWYRGEMDALIPRFEAASKAAQDSIAQRSKDLAGYRQRVATTPGLPESPELPEAPPAPKITARPFLAGMPGEDPVQSLNKAVAGLGLIAQMAVGIKGGYPQGALAAYTGALTGWAAGDQRRAANEWQTFLGELKQYDNDVSAIRMKYDDAIRRWGGDQDKLKTELGILAAEHGLGREAIELSFKDPQRAYEQLTTTAKLLGDMQQSAASLALKNAMWLDDRAIKLQDLAIKARGEERKDEQAKRTDAILQGILSGGGLPGGQGLAFQPTVSFGPAGPTVGLAPQPPSSGEAVTAAISVQRLRGAMNQIDAVRANPEQKQAIDAYLGPIGGRASWYQKVVPGGLLGQVPEPVVDMEQNIAAYRNYVIKLITGAQMGEREADRIRQEIPETTDPPDVFWRKYENSKRQVSDMEEIIARGQRGRLSQPGAPAAPSSGRIPVVGPNGEQGTVPAGTALPEGWKAR